MIKRCELKRESTLRNCQTVCHMLAYTSLTIRPYFKSPNSVVQEMK